MKTNKRIIFWDIETSLSLMGSFVLNPDYIPPENIMMDWYIICASWKELGKSKVHVASVLDKPNGDATNDALVVEKLAEVAKSADLLVAHNGDKFDIKKLNARLMYHNLEPLPPIVTLDTRKEIKKVSEFTSTSLAYLGPHLGVGDKKATSRGLWMKVLAGDRTAIKEMIAYNIKDTLLLERLYLRTRKYYRNSPNIADRRDVDCPTCNSVKVQARGVSILKSGLRYPRYQCQGCGAWFRGSKTILSNIVGVNYE